MQTFITSHLDFSGSLIIATLIFLDGYFEHDTLLSNSVNESSISSGTEPNSIAWNSEPSTIQLPASFPNASQ